MRELSYQHQLSFFEQYSHLIRERLNVCSKEQRERVYGFLEGFITEGACWSLREEFNDTDGFTIAEPWPK